MFCFFIYFYIPLSFILSTHHKQMIALSKYQDLLFTSMIHYVYISISTYFSDTKKRKTHKSTTASVSHYDYDDVLEYHYFYE